MDREIPKEVRNKERNKKIIRYGGMGAAGIVVISVLISLMRTGVKEKDIVFSQVSTGTIEVSVSASGKVVPAFEEIINSPINTRILEVYKKGGDSVDIGTPILKLDLQSAETDYKQKLDEEQMRSYKLKQLKLENMTKLNDLEMKIKVSAMQLNRKKVELRNEQYLDSLGSGTTDKVRQAELSYNVAELEYEQLKQQYANEKEVLDAEYQVQELDFSIFRKTLAETKRTLDDAQVRSPRKAILTYINNQIGAQVAEGSQIAVISDLSHFKVEGEIADTYGDRVAAGGKAIVKIGSEKLEGTVSSVTPLSKNGVISFTVQLNEDNNRRLRSGLKTDVYVMNAVKEDVMRIANASYYVGRGEYELFVRNSDKEIVKRKVQLGDSNFEFVEVIGGLQPGDEVVGHAARNEGDNAIYKVLNDIAWFRDYRFPKESALLGPVKMSVTMVNAGTQHNVIPDRCTFVVDIRSNECYTNQELFDEIRKHIACEAKARSFRLGSSHVSPEHPLVKKAVAMGRTPFGSPTLSDQALMSFPSMKIGPGKSSRSHTADEFIFVKEIEEAIALYLDLLDGAMI